MPRYQPAYTFVNSVIRARSGLQRESKEFEESEESKEWVTLTSHFSLLLWIPRIHRIPSYLFLLIRYIPVNLHIRRRPPYGNDLGPAVPIQIAHRQVLRSHSPVIGQ